MDKAPHHIAIIMDGNGRWAQNRNHSRLWGHIRGARTAKNIIEAAAELKVNHLTLFAFSSENWQRPEKEVSFLMKLLSRQLRRETQQLIKNNIRFKYIGNIAKLPEEVQFEVRSTAEKTQSCTGMTLTFALSYGGRQELTTALQNIALRCQQGLLDVLEINESLISQELESSFLPDPDLIIRTSGESRISNFFLWQSAYSEFDFINKLWPDFTAQDLFDAISRFLGRERRFGRTTGQIQSDQFQKTQAEI